MWNGPIKHYNYSYDLDPTKNYAHQLLELVLNTSTQLTDFLTGFRDLVYKELLK